MPHQCVRCGNLYDAGAEVLLKGCNCGSKFFFFVKQDALEKAKNVAKNLSKKDKDKIERDVFDIIGEIDTDNPIILNFESINIKNPGQYELDLVDLFKGKPLIYKLEEGKYMIDIVSTFEAKTLEE